MNDLISRQAAYDTLTEYYHQKTETQHQSLKEALSRVPTIDSVPVVRCKDCKHGPTMPEDGKELFHLEFPDDICPLQCEDPWYNRAPDDDWYCSNGERREE